MWTALIAAGIGCYLLKLAGLSVPPRLLGRPVVARIADLIPVALLAALVAVQVFAREQQLVLDAGPLPSGRPSYCCWCGRRSSSSSSVLPPSRRCSGWLPSAGTAWGPVPGSLPARAPPPLTVSRR